jgi:ABC-2 type transport system permease protein
MKTLLTLFRIEMKLSIREFSSALFGVILPVGLMLLLGVLYGDKMAEGGNYSLVQQSFPAVITIGICATGLMGIPITISSYREKQVLKRFKATPTSPLMLLMAQFINQFIIALLSSVLVWGVANIIFGYRMIGSLGQFMVVYLLVVLSIYAIGMMIASVAKNINTANLLCSLVYFPMFFLSGATVPYEIMPKGLQIVADSMPLTHGIIMLKSISLGGNIKDYTLTFVCLILLAIICMIISVKTFRYDYR